MNNLAAQTQSGSISLGSVGTGGSIYGDGSIFTFILSLNNGDQVRLAIWQDSLSTITLTGGMGLITTLFSGYKIY